MQRNTTSMKSSPFDGPVTKETVSRQHSWLWAGINAVMAVFFALAAYVQINDPDPYIWIPMYLVPSLLCCSIVYSQEAIDHIYWRGPAIAHMCLSVLGIIYLSIQVNHQMEDGFSNPLATEEGRELCGLLIAVGWIAMCWFSGYFMVWSAWKLSVITWLVVVLGIMPIAIWGSCYQSNFQHCNEMM